MDPEYCLQSVTRCHLCKIPTPFSPIYCDIYHIFLCKNCEEKHLSDVLIEHKVVPFQMRGYTCTFKCKKHSSKLFKRYCEHCNIPLCLECAFSGEHINHKTLDVGKNANKRYISKEDLQEYEYIIYYKYQGIAYYIPAKIAEEIENS